MSVSMIRCPSCGSNIHYTIKEKAFVCDYCGSAFSVEQLENVQVDSDNIYQEIKEQTEQAHTEWQDEENTARYGASAKAYSCPNCGAQVITDPSAATTFCCYCQGHVTLTERLAAEAEMPALVLPFKITKEQASEQFKALLKKKPFLPKVFAQQVRGEVFASLYVPFFLYDADLRGTVEAECTNVTRWSDSKYDYTKVDTYEARRSGGLAIQQLPLDGSEKMDDDTMRRLEPYDKQELVAFQTAYLSGHVAQIADTAKEKLVSSFRAIAQQVMRQQLTQTISGYTTVRVKDGSCATENIGRQYVMFPVWMISARHNSKEYMFCINGQTGKTAGKLPISMAAVLKWAGLFFGGTAALMFLAQEVAAWVR